VVLVGDLVQDIRESVTDQSQILPATVASVVVAGAGGSTLPPGTYACVVTQRNQYGETLYSGETTNLIVGANQGIQVTSALQPGATTIRAYLTLPGGNPGTEQQYVESTVSPFTISAPLPNAGTPPTQGRAYLPDTDGDAISASTLFRWINRGLELASQVAGGLLDYAGVSTVSGNPQYNVPGEWKRIASVWYDGYPLAFDDVGNYFRRNPITASVLASISVALFYDRMMVEIWPQPSRTAAQTTLAAPFNVGDTQATLTNVSGFLLTNGFAKIGTEIVAYNGKLGNILLNLQRGLGGSVAASVPQGVAVSELNLFWNGWRMFAPNYQPGDSGKVLPIPVGWGSMLFKYGLGRAKLAEQGVQEASSLEESFIKGMSDWYRTNKQYTRLQVGEQTNTLEVMPSFGGGWVVP
jgi:hypothetical protein